MSLSVEWRKRVEIWMAELKKHFYLETGTVDFKGYFTKEQLSLNQALDKEYRDTPPGYRWGSKWEYGWFSGAIILPDAVNGKRVCIKPDVGAESAVYINGINAGSIDKKHFEITLSKSGLPGSRYNIVLESYAGHGPRLENAPPNPPGRVTVPEPGQTQAVIGESTYGVWEEEAYQLWLDLDTLYQIRNNINENSLRASEIDKALRDTTIIIDFELPYDKRIETFKACRRRLKPLMECTNGSTAPMMYIFGQSHLDLAWLWPKAETERKVARTMSTQLQLMEEYQDYKFLYCEPPLNAMLKDKYPELYQRVKVMIKAGQIEPEGGIWVECDTNIPSGESLIRQLMYGKRYFMEEYGVESRLLWLPDVFGFSAVLPQLMAGCGIKYFCTKKIVDNYNGGDRFPYSIFMWEGMDGTRVLSHITRKCNSPIDPQTLIRRWESDLVQKDDISSYLFPFGYGDGGGGATRDHLEYVKRMKDIEGVPRLKMSRPCDFFENIEENGLPENKYVGELYFQAHRGTYTSQAKTKKGNRKSELAIREAEMWGAASDFLGRFSYPYKSLESIWKKLLFNQFHDILAGASIKRVHDEAEADFDEVINIAQAIRDRAAGSILEGESGVTVFNSLSWDRNELVPLPHDILGVSDESGKSLPVQKLDGRVYTEVSVPSCGWVGLKFTAENEAVVNALFVSKEILENEYIRISFDKKGEITSIYDKEMCHEVAQGICNNFRMYRDVTTCYDAWDIDSMYSMVPVELEQPAAVEVLYNGPLIAGIRVRRPLNDSELIQDITLRRGSRRVDFRTKINWSESHKLLKVAFPVNIYTDEALSEIQFGYVKRPTHKSRQYDADRFEVCNHRWTALIEQNRGFAVLNDCKYGVSTEGGCISLTLLKSALAPDMYADKGIQEFNYAFYIWNGSFIESDVIQQGYELNCPVFTVEGYSRSNSLFAVDSRCVIIEAIKPAEDGSGDIVVRLYEATKSTVHCRLRTTLGFSSAKEVSLLEEEGRTVELLNGCIELDFRPFEIKTIRLSK